MRELIIDSPSELCSFKVGLMIGQQLNPKDVLALWGDLGAGKTFLTQAIARGLGIPDQVPVTSPTFTFINEYEGRLHLFHLDLYRIGDPDELETLPWREALFGEGVAVIEWPDRLEHLLPAERFDIELAIVGDESRRITIAASGDNNRSRLAKWKDDLDAILTGPPCR
ncbi:MAG: tRNA (adenosine(37)-N6)-threonylcarbamoyltransferase complex ATPase subunit type 1 TsaE [Syntrophobacteraceae bacterium]